MNLRFSKLDWNPTLKRLELGKNADGYDSMIYGATSGAYMLFDASADQLVFDNADIQLGDNDYIKFGDASGGDVSMRWTGSLLEILPATDNIGAINIGSGTKDIDVKIFMNTTSEFVLFDVSGPTVDFGADGKGVDLRLFGETASAYAMWDQSADALILAGVARLDLSSATVLAANTDGGVIKCGTSVAPVTEDTANMKFMSFYFDNGATSGDNRAMYLRLYLTGAGGGGEAARIFTSCTDVACGTAHGSHISLSFGSTGSITGLGVAMRGTIHVPNAIAGGTYAAIQAEIYGDGASSSVSGATEYSFVRMIADGATADVKATIDTSGYLFSIQGLTAASGKLFQTNTASAATHALRIKIGSTPYYIMLTDTGA